MKIRHTGNQIMTKKRLGVFFPSNYVILSLSRIFRPSVAEQVLNSNVANPSIGEVSLGASLSMGSGCILESNADNASREPDRESASQTAIAGASLTGSVGKTFNLTPLMLNCNDSWIFFLCLNSLIIFWTFWNISEIEKQPTRSWSGRPSS